MIGLDQLVQGQTAAGHDFWAAYSDIVVLADDSVYFYGYTDRDEYRRGLMRIRDSVGPEMPQVTGEIRYKIPLEAVMRIEKVDVLESFSLCFAAGPEDKTLSIHCQGTRLHEMVFSALHHRFGEQLPVKNEQASLVEIGKWPALTIFWGFLFGGLLYVSAQAVEDGVEPGGRHALIKLFLRELASILGKIGSLLLGIWVVVAGILWLCWKSMHAPVKQAIDVRQRLGSMLVDCDPTK